jgi:hypothetical protein
VRFLAWVDHKYPELLHPDCRGRIDQAFINSWLSATPRLDPPIDLTVLKPDIFEGFLVSQKKSDGQNPGKSVYRTLRSSLVFLYSIYGIPMGVEFAAELKLFYKGLKRSVAQQSHENGSRLTEGKEPLPYSLYKLIGLEIHRTGGKDFIFCHLFLVLTWNLMCRAGNGESIHFGHLSWHEDALAIQFGHMKNDQEGERPKDPRHVYANPKSPEICPILALGVYFAVLGFSDSCRLFPGSKQYDRYSKALKRLLEYPTIMLEMQKRGLKSSDIGSHSARKGSATYVSSCSSSGPSSSSICLRAGWSLPGVQDTYVRYEGAGDQVVGRFVTGLPFESPDFALSPPFWPSSVALVSHAVQECFPLCPPQLVKICEFCLASIVYHSEYLSNTLPNDHLLFQTTLFRNPDLLCDLKSLVQCRHTTAGDAFRCSGIPPHISILVQMEFQTSTIKDILPALSGLAPTVVNSVISALDERATYFHGLNRDVLKNLMSEVFESSGIMSLVRDQLPQDDDAPQTSVLPYSGDTAPAIFNWNGSFHRVPSTFDFPSGTVANAWEYWCCGDARMQYPPLRLLQPADLPSKKHRKRLSDFRFLMNEIERLVLQAGVMINSPSVAEAASMLDAVKQSLPIDNHTETNRVRRKDHLKWSSAVNVLRKRRRTMSEVTTTSNATIHRTTMVQ